ncbi:MAG: hypothetical protein J5527_01085 [Treponema sp.]|nr:hypothetical protein [Treponema sp.]
MSTSVDITKPAAKEEIVKKSDIELPRSIDTTYEEDGVTYNYKNADAYLQVWNDAIDAKDAYEGFYAGDFTNAYSSYVDAHDACCSKLDNISHPECDKVTNYAKKAVEDFKDNYILNTSYSKEEVQALIKKAKAEVTKIESDVNEVKTAFENAKNDYDSLKSELENKYDEAVSAKNAFEAFVPEKEDHSGSNPEVQLPYPETLTDAQISIITALSSATLNDSLSSMDKILVILDAHKAEDGISDYITKVTEVRDAIRTGNPSLSNFTTLAEIEEITAVIDIEIPMINTLYEDNGSTYRYKNADAYEQVYHDALDASGDYDSYYHSDFKDAYDLYDYYHEHYNDTVNGITNPRYDRVVSYAKELVDDFKDNYVFDGYYSQEDAEYYLQNAQNEKTLNEAAVNSALTDFNNAKSAYEAVKVVLGEKYDAAIEAKNAYTSFVPETEDHTTVNPDQPDDPNQENPNTNPENPDNPQQPEQIVYTDITVTTATDLNSVDWTHAGDVTVSVPAGTVAVDVLALRAKYDSVKTKVASLTDGKTRSVDFGEYPQSVTSFTITFPDNKTNVEIMNSIVDPDELTFNVDDDSPIADRLAQIKRTEVIPGVNLVSYPAQFFEVGDRDNIIQQAFEFDKDTVVTMPSGKYNLTGAYSAGVIAKNGATLTIQNLANAELEGTKVYKENLSPIYNTFIKDQSADNLPELSLEFKGRSADFYHSVVSHLDSSGVNLYNTDIDNIIKKYYSNGLNNKLSFSTKGFHVIFDAREYLNGSSMYQANIYNSSAYDLDVNAALFFDTLANVNVTGVRNSNLSAKHGVTFMNTRFESDMSGVEFIDPSAKGVVDFVGGAPSLTPKAYNAKVIIENVGSNSRIDVEAAAELDLSKLSANGTKILYSKNNSYSTVALFGSNEAMGQASHVYAVNSLVGSTNTVTGLTSEDIEKGAREGKKPSDLVSQLSSKSNSIKSKLLRVILNDEQKQYS